jgi:hypothetical protein
MVMNDVHMEMITDPSLIPEVLPGKATVTSPKRKCCYID